MSTSTLLQLKSQFWANMLERYTGAATGGSSKKLTDSSLVGYVSESWPAKLDNVQLRVTSGSATGDLRYVGTVNRAVGDLFPNRDFSAAVASTDTYELWGTAINGGQPLTDLFNYVLRTLRPVTETAITIVSSQRRYDITTLVQTKEDVRGVAYHLLDPKALEPFREIQLKQGLDYTVHDLGGGGTTSVVLELALALNLDATQRELWLRHEKTFTAFSSDTSTVDAVYLDWLAWEALYELTLRKLVTSSSDKSRWTAMRDRAAEMVSMWRGRWLSSEPIEISTFDLGDDGRRHWRWGYRW